MALSSSSHTELAPIWCPQFVTERLFSFQTNLETMITAFFLPATLSCARLLGAWQQVHNFLAWRHKWTRGDMLCGYMYCFLRILKDFYLRFFISLRLNVIKPWSFSLKKKRIHVIKSVEFPSPTRSRQVLCVLLHGCMHGLHDVLLTLTERHSENRATRHKIYEFLHGVDQR